MLARLRLGPDNLRGRRFPEPAHLYRNDFQRDRDRIIHSRAFRRLEGKTQVFAPSFGDHFRNRLTHTIEVAQVARTMAVVLNLNEEYTEALALAHDLGHPPFGHSGEEELDRQMRVFGGRFEHNRQALRIVDLLEERYARFDGLNLTFEVREGILKHSRELLEGDDPELNDLLPGVRPPLEAQLLDIADEIAYNTADLDDGFSAGLLSIEEIGAAVPVVSELVERVDTQFPGVSERVRFWEIQRQLMNVLIGGFIEGTLRAAADAGVETAADVRGLKHRIASMSAETAGINKQLKTLLVSRVYGNQSLADLRIAAVKKIGELFAFLVQHPKHVSPGYQGALKTMPAHRVVCDYISGMTDMYFLKTYQTLLGA